MNPNQATSLSYQAYSIRESSDGHEFSFTTDKGIVYLVYFAEADGYLPSASFAQQTKMFGFGPTDATRPAGRLLKDERVNTTIFEILYHYFTRYPGTILVFVCSEESPWRPGPGHKDPRYAYWRRNAFRDWFEEWKKIGVMPAEKVDYDLYGYIHCSCLFRSGNRYETEVRQVIHNTRLAKQP